MMVTDWEGWARHLAKNLETVLTTDVDMPNGPDDLQAADECLSDYQVWEGKQR